MGKHFFARLVGACAVFAIVSVPAAVASAAFADDASTLSTATVSNGQELRTQWAIGDNTLITLTGNVDLGLGPTGNDVCGGSGSTFEPIRTTSQASPPHAITIDGQGKYGITQSCTDQRVLRDDYPGETVTLTGLTYFTGGNAQGNGGGLQNDGPVNVVNSNVSGNDAHSNCLQPVSTSSDADSQAQVCFEADGGGINAGDTGAQPNAQIIGVGYAIVVTDSTIANNTADSDGGGVYTEDTVTATGSHFSANVAKGNFPGGGGRGGGAFGGDGVTSTSTTFENNDAQCGYFSSGCASISSGGGFYTEAGAQVDGSTFTGNHAYDSGGGFFAPSGAVVNNSTFTNNQAGGESDTLGASSASQLPGTLGAHATAVGSEDCTCAGGGFAVGLQVATGVASPVGSAQVTGSTFVANGAGCDTACLGAGGGFFATSGATVSGSTFGDGTDDGSNAAGCFQVCGAMGGGFFSSGAVSVDTSTFLLNGVGCLGGCTADGGGFFGGTAQLLLGSVDGLADALPDGVAAQVVNPGSITVDQSTFTANEAGCIFGPCAGGGGGFYASENDTVDVTASTFNENDALFDGGAFSVNGGVGTFVTCVSACGTTVTVTNSTVTGNKSGYPAAISVPSDADTLELVNDTIDSNIILEHLFPSSLEGDAHQAECQCYAANVWAFSLTSFGTDVTNPLSEEAPDEMSTAALIPVENCWVGNTNSEGYNYSDDHSCDFDDSTDSEHSSNDPLLGALADNGGPTQTMLPQFDSPLIDRIQPISECEVDVDQRGVSRPQIHGCDTGAVEVRPASLDVTKVVTGTQGHSVPADGYTFTVECTDGSQATLSVADATNGGTSGTLDDIHPGSTCTVTEHAVVYTDPDVSGQPQVSYDTSPTGTLEEGEDATVTVTNDYSLVDLLGESVVTPVTPVTPPPAPAAAAVTNVAPKFTG